MVSKILWTLDGYFTYLHIDLNSFKQRNRVSKIINPFCHGLNQIWIHIFFGGMIKTCSFLLQDRSQWGSTEIGHQKIDASDFSLVISTIPVFSIFELVIGVNQIANDWTLSENSVSLGSCSWNCHGSSLTEFQQHTHWLQIRFDEKLRNILIGPYRAICLTVQIVFFWCWREGTWQDGTGRDGMDGWGSIYIVHSAIGSGVGPARLKPQQQDIPRLSDSWLLDPLGKYFVVCKSVFVHCLCHVKTLVCYQFQQGHMVIFQYIIDWITRAPNQVNLTIEPYWTWPDRAMLTWWAMVGLPVKTWTRSTSQE